MSLTLQPAEGWMITVPYGNWFSLLAMIALAVVLGALTEALKGSLLQMLRQRMRPRGTAGAPVEEADKETSDEGEEEIFERADSPSASQAEDEIPKAFRA